MKIEFQFSFLSSMQIVGVTRKLLLGQSIGIDENNKGQSIGIDENNTLQFKFVFWHENCGRHRFGRLVGMRVGVAPC